VGSPSSRSSQVSISSAPPVSGRAELAVLNSEKGRQVKTPTPKPPSAKEQAAEVTRLRNQIEAVENARKALQDQAALRRKAKNAALARYQALQKTNNDSRKERASRDAARKELEGTPKEIAFNLLDNHGWSESQFSCLDKLWTKESRWKVNADNPTSSAYGIPQALPGRRMAAYGSDWRTNPVTQIKWGLDYIEDAHGSPCEAWAHSKAKNWY
jgi:flagellar biosynthesis GTPase FlhF